jgi:hypothetical protein
MDNVDVTDRVKAKQITELVFHCLALITFSFVFSLVSCHNGMGLETTNNACHMIFWYNERNLELFCTINNYHTVRCEPN